ncbi:MAG: M13 family peptidase, partial [Gemmatimonadales bacterium]|nr:M13 family peptidase [Gemmatimonadales bacterium]
MRSIRLAVALTVAIAAPLAAQQPIPGLDAAGMDRSVRPGDDFFGYANGGWVRASVIPADRSAIGAFSIAAQRADTQLAQVVRDAAAANAAHGTDVQRIGDFYTSYRDTAA